jgi:DNA (cytosine-5)-methyltransferase 1
MPAQKRRKRVRALSLFSGGGGLDLGFDLAGFDHVASYELIPVCGETILENRSRWKVFSGPTDGDVTGVSWESYKNNIDIVHGGPPCQPFSIAGSQKGHSDERNMWPEFSRCVNTLLPMAFVAENVLGITNSKFEPFIKKYIYNAMPSYNITAFTMNASDYGVPQIRKRMFFVGIRTDLSGAKFSKPNPTHIFQYDNSNDLEQFDMFSSTKLERTMGVREALGLTKSGFDTLAPTLRSGFTGKRNTTSILNSAAAQKTWEQLGIWPNGVQLNRQDAAKYPTKNGTFRLSVQDCALLQGFPEDWRFCGAAYQVIGQIGNSVAPPVAYRVAMSLFNTIKTYL